MVNTQRAKKIFLYLVALTFIIIALEYLSITNILGDSNNNAQHQQQQQNAIRLKVDIDADNDDIFNSNKYEGEDDIDDVSPVRVSSSPTPSTTPITIINDNDDKQELDQKLKPKDEDDSDNEELSLNRFKGSESKNTGNEDDEDLMVDPTSNNKQKDITNSKNDDNPINMDISADSSPPLPNNPQESSKDDIPQLNTFNSNSDSNNNGSSSRNTSLPLSDNYKYNIVKYRGTKGYSVVLRNVYLMRKEQERLNREEEKVLLGLVIEEYQNESKWIDKLNPSFISASTPFELKNNNNYKSPKFNQKDSSLTIYNLLNNNNNIVNQHEIITTIYNLNTTNQQWKLNSTLNPLLLPKPHIFIHIPKTAGTSLVEVFKTNLESTYNGKMFHKTSNPSIKERSNITESEVIFGHIHFGLHLYHQRVYPEQPQQRLDHLNKYSYMTMLRDPVDRVISHYYFLRDSDGHPQHALAMVFNLTTWMDESPIGDNEQTRRLVGLSRNDELTPEHLEIALFHLKYSFKYVGIMERYQESLVLLSLKAGLPTIELSKTNIGRERKMVELDQETIVRIQDKNWMDIIVYEQACKIFQQELDLLDKDYLQFELSKLNKI